MFVIITISNSSSNMLTVMLLRVFLTVLLHLPNVAVATNQFPFYDTSLSWDERVDDLVSRLTVEEIIPQLSHGGTSPGSGPAPAIPHLGIKEYGWNTECLRGVADAGPATSFPQALGLAASFNRTLLFSIAEATSKEARAKYSKHIKTGAKIGNHMGISCFSPVVNIMRHPLWGRNQETYGEDPYLSGELGKMYVQGLQGNHPRYLRTNGGCKHFDVYSGPENIPEHKYSFDAKVTERDWRLTFLPAFYKCIVEGNSYSTMCSYNKINGVPACANKKLLIDILRKEWNFKGYVVADQDALVNIVKHHQWKNTEEEAAAASLLAGTNLEISTSNPTNTFSYLQVALDKKLITEKNLRDAVKPLFYVRMKLGEFDPPEMNPYTTYNIDLIQSPKHRELSIHAAAQSFVLLKNNGILPLKSKPLHELALIGPMADDSKQLSGNFGPTLDKYFSTPRDALSNITNSMTYNKGCDDVKCQKYYQKRVKEVLTSNKFDLIILCLGSGVATESESNDRADMQLPGKQAELLQDVIQLKNNTPIVLLLFTAGPLQIDPELLQQVDAIVNCFYPSQSTGGGLLRLLFNEGPGSNPAGRLPFTWPADLSQVPDIVSYSMENRTYRYWKQNSPLFPFGYGLSYTTFSYSDLSITNNLPLIGEDVILQVTIENTGAYDGDEVVQVYITWVDPPEPMPVLQLVAFDRIHIQSGYKIQWSVTIKAMQLSVYLDQLGFQQVPGDIKFYVSGQQPHQAVHLSTNVLESTIIIRQQSHSEF